MTGPQPTEDDLLMDLIKTNRSTEGETMTQKQYEKHGDYNPWQAVNRFGSWNNARASAGIYQDQRTGKKIKDKEILEDLKKVSENTEGQAKTQDYRDKGEYSISLIYNRFSSYSSAREKAYNI